MRALAIVLLAVWMVPLVASQATESTVRGTVLIEGDVTPNSYSADIRTLGKSIFSEGIVTIEDGQSEFEVMNNADGGVINGLVQMANAEPVSSARVVSISSLQRGIPVVIYQATKSDAQGRFTLRGIAPGAYRLLAVKGIPPGAEENPEFLAAYLNGSQPVVVQKNSLNDILLRLVTK